MVEAAFYLCAYEFAIKTANSPWCRLFDEVDGQVRSHLHALKLLEIQWERFIYRQIRFRLRALSDLLYSEYSGQFIARCEVRPGVQPASFHHRLIWFTLVSVFFFCHNREGSLKFANLKKTFSLLLYVFGVFQFLTSCHKNIYKT